MTTLKEIRDHADAYTKAKAALAAHGDQLREIDLDVAIAKRSGDQVAIDAALAARADHMKDWHVLYNAPGNALKAMFDALGIVVGRYDVK